MEEAFLKLIVTVPAAAAVIVTAWLFLRSMKELNSHWSDTVTKITQLAQEDRHELKTVIGDNTKALTLVAERLYRHFTENHHDSL